MSETTGPSSTVEGIGTEIGAEVGIETEDIMKGRESKNNKGNDRTH